MENIRHSHDYRACYDQIHGLIELTSDLPLWMRDRPMIEVGSNTGDSTQIFSLFFKDVTCIDTWEDDPHLDRKGHEVFYRFNQKVGYRGITTIISTSEGIFTNPELLAKLPKNPAFIYIDANHSYPFVKKDVLSFWPLLCPEGIMAGHDFGLATLNNDGVKPAVLELFGEPDFVYRDSSWMIKKTEGRKILC